MQDHEGQTMITAEPTVMFLKETKYKWWTYKISGIQDPKQFERHHLPYRTSYPYYAKGYMADAAHPMDECDIKAWWMEAYFSTDR
jgi:hypothetical protein